MSNESNGRLWLNDPANVWGDALVELDDAAVTAERTEDDEVAIHATLDGDEQAVASLYLSTAAAALLAARLMAASVPQTYAEATTRESGSDEG